MGHLSVRDGLSRHPEHDADLLSAIGPHASQEQRDDRDVAQPGDRGEKDVHRGTLVVRRRALVQRGSQADAKWLNGHVEIVGGDVRRSGSQPLSSLRLNYAHRADAIEPLRERRRESRRHVLDDDHWRQVGPQARQEGLDGVRPPN